MIFRIYNRPMSYFIEFVDVHKSFGDRKVLDGFRSASRREKRLRFSGPAASEKP